MARAVVFAYHDVGVRCLRVLLDRGVDVRLVVTHEDDPGENIWFGSVRQTAREYDLPCIAPADPNSTDIVRRVIECDADLLFSFYYRLMLKAPLLDSVARRAYNLHGSLLPKYRGRAPVNWAVIRGESETGATLHVMNESPDSGAIVDQMAVPILRDDTARDVLGKVMVAGEMILQRCLPDLIAGRVQPRPQDLAQGAYFGGRKPEDGRLDWTRSAREIHNLVRGVSHPYPGAFSDTPRGRLFLWRTRSLGQTRPGPAGLLAHDGWLLARGGDGGLLRVLEAELAAHPLDAAVLERLGEPLTF